MELGIAGKTALVTGAGRGLGAGIARALAAEGVRVLATSRGAASLEETMDSLPQLLGHESLAIDIEQQGAVERLLSWLDSRETPIDIVINNVGGTMGMDDPLSSFDNFSRVIALNLGVAVDVNRHIIPSMISRGWGRVCHVSSISALENQGPPAYCAAKAALNAYVRSLGRYVSEHNVILTGIMPGAVFTEGGYWDTTSQMRPEHVDRYLAERMAIKRFGTEAEIADAVAFLVSERASFLVGSILLADGGQGRTFFSQES